MNKRLAMPVSARPVIFNPSDFVSVKDLTLPALYEVLDEDLARRRRQRAAPRRQAALSYSHPDQGDDPQHDPHRDRDIEMVKRIARVLEFHYPGHPWFVQCSHARGVATIELPPLVIKPLCGIVKLSDTLADPGLKIVTRVAGDILERFRLPRGKYDYADFKAACAKRSLRDIRRGTIPT